MSKLRIVLLTLVAILLFSCGGDSIKKLSKQEDIDSLMKEVAEKMEGKQVQMVTIYGIGDTSEQVDKVNIDYKEDDGVYYTVDVKKGELTEPIKSNIQTNTAPTKDIAEFTFDKVVKIYEKTLPKIKETVKKNNLTVSYAGIHKLSKSFYKNGDYGMTITVALTVKEEKGTYYTVDINVDSKGKVEVSYL